MALGSEEADFNAGVDALHVLWEAMVDALDANEQIRITWQMSRYGDNASDSTQGSDATAVFDPTGRVYYWSNNPNTTDDMPFEIGGRPLFFKITNAAGDLT